MHPGSGRGGDVVDLQIQRDEFDMPVIWASELKGTVRSSFALDCGDDNCRKEVNAIFGPEAGAPDYSSAVSFLDARLLLIPARSLRGVWVYVTSPHLLSYYSTYLYALSGLNGHLKESYRKKHEDLDKLISDVREAMGNGKSLASAGEYTINDKVVINELELEAKIDQKGVKKKLADLLGGELGNKVSAAGLVVVDDDVIRDIVRRSLIVQTRVRLDRATKTVVSGGLWEEEYLPQHSLMASAVLCSSTKASNDELKDPRKICEKLTKLGSVVIGGKETVGKGLAKLWWLE
ncbi:type III-B CRISPR module RAMP protein Cmr4 [Thermocladium modestius]|uniref:Type III-B CRISPR module RAMP protein Cmr4 n=2 Tax=Thermocladium modestius TaxID=62609 RepID=A0A830GTD6_9CREN|nr:type III-B CRISPR module RAMP protein Cmr4 [Thermocladium modestius]